MRIDIMRAVTVGDMMKEIIIMKVGGGAEALALGIGEVGAGAGVLEEGGTAVQLGMGVKRDVL